MVIQIGCNDDRRIPRDTFKSSLEELIGKLQKEKIQVVQCTLTSVGEKHDGTNKDDAKLDEFAAVEREVAQRSQLEHVVALFEEQVRLDSHLRDEPTIEDVSTAVLLDRVRPLGAMDLEQPLLFWARRRVTLEATQLRPLDLKLDEASQRFSIRAPELGEA